jgi:serine/threonine protein kinase
MANDYLVGKTLDEYRLEELLGRGGMARVYQAFDTRLKRWAAIKVIATPFRSDSDYIIRFEREAQAIAQLEHSNVVSIYRYGEVDDLLYIAMQYVEGVALDILLQKYREEGDYIPSADVLKIVTDVCHALDYVHSKGVIHRDIKPANIILNKEGQAVLVDFGLALLESAGTQGEIFGTPHYIAPEQAISSAGATPHSDLYAVGVILYEMFTGVVPFDADSAMSIAMQHMSELPEPPRQIRPEISLAVEAVILKTLEKEPQDRYSRGADLVAALEEALQTGQISSVTPTTPQVSVMDRVAVGLVERPMPPMPAGVSTANPEPVPPATPEPKPTAVPETKVGAAPTQPSSSSVSAKTGHNRMLYGIIGLVAVLVICGLFMGGWWVFGMSGNPPAADQESANQALSNNATPTLTASEAEPTSTETEAVVTPETEPTFTATPSETPVPPTATNSPTPQPTSTDTPIPPLLVPTDTPTPVPPTATNSPTPQPTPTDTPTVPSTATNSPTPQPTPTDTPTVPPPNTATLTPSPTATETGTPTAEVPQPIADTRTDFSGTQGGNNWTYQWSRDRESFDWVNMQFDGGCWRIDSREPVTEPSVRICRNTVHPGLTGDIAWRWTSTMAGNVWAQVFAYKIDTGGGDGVDIVLYRNTDELKRWRLNGNDNNGFSEGLSVDVIKGDYIFAVIKVRGDSSYDETGFRAQIYP